jgi:polyphosphate kinase 2 (PPK2 family)
MFETAEVGHTLSKAQYDRELPQVWKRLLLAQTQMREKRFPLIIVVSGVEMAGKSEVVSRLNQWLDARGVQTVAFWDESDEERERPRYWRFWRSMPAAGTTALLLGSWYTDPIVRRTHKKIGRKEFEAELGRIVELERMLTDDGALVVKLWFHISRKEQKRRLAKLKKQFKRKLTPYEKSFARLYDRFLESSETALRETDLGHSPWHVIDAHDHRYRDLTAARKLLEALDQRIAGEITAPKTQAHRSTPPADALTVLDTVDLTAKVAKPRY